MTAIHDESALRALLGEPTQLVRAKVRDRLNALTRRFVDRSPFVILATAAPDGTCADDELLAGCAVEGKTPQLGLRVEIDEVFAHRPKAFLRAQLWEPSQYVDRAELPSSGEIHRSLNPSFDADAYDAERAERYARREGFY